MLLLSRTNCRNPPLYIYNAYKKHSCVWTCVFLIYENSTWSRRRMNYFACTAPPHRPRPQITSLTHIYTTKCSTCCLRTHTHIHTTGVDWSSSFKQAHTHHQPKIRKNVDCCYVKNYTHYTIYTFYTVPAISNNTTYFLWFGFGGELTHKLGLRCYCYI